MWDTAAEVAAVATEAVLATPHEEPVALNLNVPNCPVDQLNGWRHAEVGTLPPRAIADARLVPKIGHHGAYSVELEWGDPIDLPAHTDGGTVERDYVSVTNLSRFRHEDRPDMGSLDSALDRLFA